MLNGSHPNDDQNEGPMPLDGLTPEQRRTLDLFAVRDDGGRWWRNFRAYVSLLSPAQADELWAREEALLADLQDILVGLLLRDVDFDAELQRILDGEGK